MPTLRNLDDWKQFEHLCADLLEAEGLTITSEPHIDRSGIDLQATEEFRSHASSKTIILRWRVQCKHYAGSGRNLGRKEIESCLNSYQATRDHDEGLLLIVSTDYTEAGKDVIDQFTRLHPGARITIWNERQIIARLARHPNILLRYGLAQAVPDFFTKFERLRNSAAGDILVISDQSLLAHNLIAALRHGGMNVICISFWNYLDPVRAEMFSATVDQQCVRLAICFLGDSFGFPMPRAITTLIESLHSAGAPLLLFPFLAWSLRRGIYLNFGEFCPVELVDPTDAAESFPTYQILGAFQKGDFRWLLAFDSFAEDRYVELDPATVTHSISKGVPGPFGISHSFEYLKTRNAGRVLWSDTAGNPFVVVGHSDQQRVCYINTCCHACLSTIPISSPLEASNEFATVLCNVVEWLLDGTVSDATS